MFLQVDVFPNIPNTVLGVFGLLLVLIFLFIIKPLITRFFNLLDALPPAMNRMADQQEKMTTTLDNHLQTDHRSLEEIASRLKSIDEKVGQ